MILSGPFGDCTVEDLIWGGPRAELYLEELFGESSSD